MNIGGVIVTFMILWWLIFFMTLPFGAAPPDEVGEGHATSAPAKPRLWTKALITTVLAILLTYGTSVIISSGIIDLRPEELTQ